MEYGKEPGSLEARRPAHATAATAPDVHKTAVHTRPNDRPTDRQAASNASHCPSSASGCRSPSCDVVHSKLWALLDAFVQQPRYVFQARSVSKPGWPPHASPQACLVEAPEALDFRCLLWPSTASHWLCAAGALGTRVLLVHCAPHCLKVGRHRRRLTPESGSRSAPLGLRPTVGTKRVTARHRRARGSNA